MWSIHMYGAISPGARISLGTKREKGKWHPLLLHVMTFFKYLLPFLVPMLFSKRECALGGSTELKMDTATCLYCLLLRNQPNTVKQWPESSQIKEEIIRSPSCSTVRWVWGGNHLRLDLPPEEVVFAESMGVVWFHRMPGGNQQCDWRYHGVSWTVGT